LLDLTASSIFLFSAAGDFFKQARDQRGPAGLM
jgi:hypothetical protein